MKRSYILAMVMVLLLTTFTMTAAATGVNLSPSPEDSATLMSGPSVNPYNPDEQVGGYYVDVPHLTPGVVTSYSDTRGHWGEQEISDATKNGLMNGMGDGTFAPDEKVTLGQAITVYLRTCRFSETKISSAYSQKYADVVEAGWLIPSISVYAYLDPSYPSKNQYDSYGRLIYGANRPATREDVAEMFGAGADLYLTRNPGTQLSCPFRDIGQLNKKTQRRIAYLYTIGVVKGYPDGDFHPEAEITRAEFAALSNRAFVRGVSDYYILPEVK